ncbi:questin oxidase family protein [Undibacterium sp. Ji83W]|uniref:questin oxidase family protein n=1 Tax=Undibacterium sp. Ji83W TaxID=3413043 RepID=UPI003BEF993A
MTASTTAMCSNVLLKDLLDKNRDFALNGKGTTNHCPMALCALAGMGADDRRLQDFFAHWRDTYALPALPLTEAIRYEDFQAYLGKRENFADLQSCFAIRLAEHGKSEVIKEVFALVPFAPATTAFHALIRLAYGLQAEHAGEIAASLAALVAANFDIDIDMQGRQAANSVAAGFQKLSQSMRGKTYPGRMIAEKMRAVVNDEQFLENLPGMPVTENLLDELALWAISAYGQTRDFTILHIVTGVNAARQVIAYLDQKTLASKLQELWIALCVAYVSVGAPAVIDAAIYESHMRAKHRQLCSWSDLFARAKESNDDHVIKLTYTCALEISLRPNLLYQMVVMEMLGTQIESFAC